MTDDKQKRDFTSVMDKLRANYVAGLAAKANMLAETLAGIQAGEDGADASLAQQIHRLAGTAGSFGVNDVSDVANALDIRLHNGEQPAELADELTAFAALLRARCAPTES